MTDFPQQKEWKVLSVREGKETDNPHGGKLKAFYVDFEGADDVYWRRKMPAEVKAGETYFGTISRNQHGLTFKKEQPQQGASSSAGGTNHSSGRSYKPESEFDPEKVARIGRAHAQEMALRTLAIHRAGRPFEEGVDAKAEIRAWADWFEADVDAAATRARGAAPSPEASSAPSSAQQPQPNEREKFRELFEMKALSPEAASKLADFTMKMTPEQRVRAWNGLGQLDTEMETLKKLEDSFREVEGESLSDSAIPF